MRKVWSEQAWEDYLYWQKQDRKTLKRINQLIEDVERHPFEGIGKPEHLRHVMPDVWSRRIDQKNRLIYSVVDDSLLISSVKNHYSD